MSGFFMNNINDSELKRQLNTSSIEESKCRHKYDFMINILKKPANKRTEDEVTHVVDLIKKLKFFKER